MYKNKILIEAQYIKLSPEIIDLFNDRYNTLQHFKKTIEFFMVGNELEIHMSDGYTVKLKESDWEPLYQG